ncbi:MAG: hypothetical protein J6D18_04990 [Erysipelotrichaceae bacterium]|nr:hypothetical protein [Erysipelotrichaceae bacterium]
MNVYTYFQTVNTDESQVPSKNIHLLRWSVSRMKEVFLSGEQMDRLSQSMVSQLQNDEDLNEEKYKQSFLKKIKEYQKRNRIPFWMDWIDLPLIQLVLIVIAHHLYQYWLVPFLQGQPILWQIPVGPGLLLRCGGTYLLVKGLLIFFSRQPDRSKIGFWMILSILFFGYLWVQYTSTQWDQHPLFMIGMGWWILYNCLLTALSLYILKRKREQWKN